MSLPPDTVFTATTPEQARLLTDLGYYRLLGALMKEECSASELARMVSLSVQQVHHRLTRLLTADLIEVVGERRRSGRPVKLYRAPHEYRVPFHLTDAATLGELIQVSHQPMLDTHYRAMTTLAGGGRDLRLFRGQGGRTEFQLAEQPGDTLQDQTAVVLSAFISYRLTPETLRELQARFGDLLEWLTTQNLPRDQEGRDYLLGVLLAPGKVGE